MSENVVSIDKNLNICDCLRMMYKDNLSRIPVTATNENKKSFSWNYLRKRYC